MNKNDEPHLILIIQTAFLGDIVLTIPFLRVLRSHFKNAEILLLTTPVGEELLNDQDVADRIIIYDKNGRERGLKSYAAKIKEIKAYNFDTVISPHRSMRSGTIALFSGAKNRVGYSIPSLIPFYNVRVKRDKLQHEVDRIFALLEPFHIKPSSGERYPLINVTGIQRSSNTIGIAPGSVWHTKRWLGKGYADVIKQLHKNDFNIVLIGSKEDKPVSDRIRSLVDAEITDLTGKTDIHDLIKTIAGLTLLITNDNGAMQVAQAVNTPIIAIFGPTIPEQGFAPMRPNTVIVQAGKLYCRPCSPHGPNECPEGHFLCMNSIKPEHVMNAVHALLV
ncbi:MAG: glycosyltransferase family 9 protein [Deltaproteobacteria bacterium]|nr:glycosyltransferase family 9 protein [Deltaproteobacteria bacterium]MCL5791768.1 glycosyltransferase family 9 protein [Deltaproteobacteria bacterium]